MSTTVLNGKQHQIENKQQQLLAIQPQYIVNYQQLWFQALAEADDQ